ncbi:hypothetical protein RJ641_023235, partial [Dillenia turbinata]
MDVLKIHSIEAKKIKQMLDDCPTRICFTSNLWTSIAIDHNGSANDLAIELLKNQLSFQGYLLNDGSYFHICCCAHVSNLTMQKGLKVIDHSIEKIRECMKYVKDSRLENKYFWIMLLKSLWIVKKSLRDKMFLQDRTPLILYLE